MGQSVDRRTDIFSAGVTFYELLADKHPFIDGLQFEQTLRKSEFASLASSINCAGGWPRDLQHRRPDARQATGRSLSGLYGHPSRDREGDAAIEPRGPTIPV